MFFYTTVCTCFFFCFVTVLICDCFPVSQEQSEAASSSLPPTLLLSALDVEAMVKEGYDDVLLRIYDFFDEKFTNLKIPYDENTIGSVKTLREVLDILMDSSKVSAALKTSIRIVTSFLREQKQLENTEPTPLSGTVLEEKNYCVHRDRLVMVPLDFNILKSAGQIDTLNRVVSYLNRHPNEALFVDEYFSSENPLLPFYVLLTSLTANSEVKNDVMTLFPYLEVAHILDTPGDFNSKGDKSMTSFNNAENSFRNDNVTNRTHYSSVSVSDKYKDDVGLSGKNASKAVDPYSSLPLSSITASGSEFGVDNETLKFNNGNIHRQTAWPFSVLKTSQEMLTYRPNLKQAFLIFQKLFFDTLSTIHLQTESTGHLMQQLFSTFINTTTGDEKFKNGIKELINFLSIKNPIFDFDLKDSINEITQKLRTRLMEDLSIICNKSNSSSITEEFTEELINNLTTYIELDEKLKEKIKYMVLRLCGSNFSTLSSSNTLPIPKGLDKQRLQEIQRLLAKYETKHSVNVLNKSYLLNTNNNKLNADVDRLLKLYGFSPTNILPLKNKNITESFSERVRFLIEKHDLQENLTQEKDAYITVVTIPEYYLETKTLEEKLKEDIIELVEKYAHCKEDTSLTTNYSSRDRNIEYIHNIAKDIKSLPLDMDKLIDAGCYSSLIRLYEYFKTRSYDITLLSAKNITEKFYLIRDITDMLSHNNFISGELKTDLMCVTPYIINGSSIEKGTSKSKRTRQLEKVYKMDNENKYISVLLWPLDFAQIILDGYEENLKRLILHLYDHYHDLFISTQKAEAERNEIFREVLEKIMLSSTVKAELKRDIRIISQYVRNEDNESVRTLSYTNKIFKELNLDETLYPLDREQLLNDGFSNSLERVLKFCKNISCDAVLESVKNTRHKSDTFRELLGVMTSFRSSDDQLKEDINIISSYILDNKFNNEVHEKQ